MSAKNIKEAFLLPKALLNAFETNNRINEFLIEGLDEAAWRAEPPDGKGRSIAAIAAHMHNVRVMWMKAAKGAKIPPQLDRHRVTRKQALLALRESTVALHDLLADAIASDGRIKNFRPDAASFFSYLIAHDAHHRGQITMLARQSGHPISQKVMFGMWEWGSR